MLLQKELCVNDTRNYNFVRTCLFLHDQSGSILVVMVQLLLLLSHKNLYYNKPRINLLLQVSIFKHDWENLLKVLVVVLKEIWYVYKVLLATGPRDMPYYPLDGGGIIHAKGLIVAGFSPPFNLP